MKKHTLYGEFLHFGVFQTKNKTLLESCNVNCATLALATTRGKDAVKRSET